MTPCQTTGRSELAAIRELGRGTPVLTSTSQSGLGLREEKVKVKAAGRGLLAELWVTTSGIMMKKVPGLWGAHQERGVSGSPPLGSRGFGWNLALMRSM